MCIGIGTPQAQTPAPPPPAPTPVPIKRFTAKTADTVGRAQPKSKKKSSFRRVKSGGTRTTALNLTPKKTS
jgi:hypothetical protein